MKNQCADCRDSDHPDYTEHNRLVIIREPETGVFVKRARLCFDHLEAYHYDGYFVDYQD